MPYCRRLSTNELFVNALDQDARGTAHRIVGPCRDVTLIRTGPMGVVYRIVDRPHVPRHARAVQGTLWRLMPICTAIFVAVSFATAIYFSGETL